MTDKRWQIHKFGGSSLADADCFRRVAGILLEQPQGRQAVVVSAMARTTDALLGLVTAAEQGADDVRARLEALAGRYRSTVTSLLKQRSVAEEVLTAFNDELSDVADVLHAISLVRAAGERSRDLIAGHGEIWSARLLAAHLRERSRQLDCDLAVSWLDARQLILVERGEMGPVVLWEESRKRADQLLAGSGNQLVVITGFIAADRNGLCVTLGRNGSDFSASIVGGLASAEKISIWTDVDGVMSADPNRVPEASIIRELSYNEAMELAYFGAKVIHPQTMSPAVQRGIPIWIRNTFNPAAAGSLIGSGSDPAQPIKGITSIEGLTLVNLEGSGMIGVPGTADRLFGALREAGVSVILISQASSEHSICFAVPGAMARSAEQVVRRAFALELEQGQIHSVSLQADCSIIAVVGDGMAGMPGIAGKFFGTLGNAGINVKAIAQGSSERNISAVIAGSDATRALRAVHSGFYLSAETVSIGLIGPGHVGAVLLDQMAAQLDRLREQFNLDLRVRALANSRQMLLAEQSVNLSDWRSQMAAARSTMDAAAFAAHVNADHIPHAVIIDCSASGAVAAHYPAWLEAGIHIVTPNKKAHSSALADYDRLQVARRRHNARFLYETTVGAALPIIGTLRDLKETGDEIRSIEGIFSGTLAYLFNMFDGSKPFSTIVREARDAGYTEPDPRDDLSGMDVARKLIILGREMGLRLEMSDLHIESLIPTGLESGDVEAFLAALPAHDTAMLERWQQAKSAGHILRYVGRLTADGRATVRLEALPLDHPFAGINLTDNIVRFESARYSENPLVIQGPGAGPVVTAAGVFADVLRLAAYLGAPI